jgi:hypothetical protein
MSRPTPARVNNSRWMGWQPTQQIIANSARSAPTRPTKPGFEGFVSDLSAKSAKMLAEPVGSQVFLRALPQTIDHIGNPRPATAAPKTHCGLQKPIETTVDFGPERTRLMSWPEGKAAALNQLFLEQGRAGKPGRITAEVVRHGERAPHRTGTRVWPLRKG